MKSVPVLILSNNQTLSHSLERWLMQSEGIEVCSFVAEHHDLDCLERLIAEKDPIVALALRMPAADDFETIRVLRTAHPDIRIITIAPICTDEYTRIVKAIGATICIAYKDLDRDLIPAVRRLDRTPGWNAIE
ncbi:MAG: hypothetical protein IPK19_26570 [Chloroflexi bacterium]|nr:hypothetical protein [Chloroflexota bacterium]